MKDVDKERHRTSCTCLGDVVCSQEHVVGCSWKDLEASASQRLLLFHLSLSVQHAGCTPCLTSSKL